MFPYPEQPEEWQSAYTRDQAFKDSGRYSDIASLALSVCVLIISSYIAIRAMPFLHFERLLEWVIVIILVIAVVFLLVAAAQTMATNIAARFLVEFYRPPAEVNATQVINYRLYGKFKLPPPLNIFSKFESVTIKDGKIDKGKKWVVWSAQHLGGPINLTVFDGSAVYLERGNRFSRVVGPGAMFPFLEWFETIKYVVDLRPNVKDGSFDVWTKDGIKIRFTARVVCRIGDPVQKGPDPELVYPFDPAAVKKAIERYGLRWLNSKEEPLELTWIDAAWGAVTDIVPGYIGSRMLDDLLIAGPEGGQILSPSAIQELIQELDKASNTFGVYIMDFQIQNIETPAKVVDQQNENWKAERLGEETIINGQVKAFGIRSREKARADAQKELILAIAEGLEKNVSRNFAEPLLLSLTGILDQSLQDPTMRAHLAGETMDTLEKVQKLLNRQTRSGDDDASK